MTSLAEQHFTRYIYDHYQAADLDDFIQFTRVLFDEAIDAELDQNDRQSAQRHYQLAISLWHFVSANQQDSHQVKLAPVNEGSATALFILSEDKAFIVDSISSLLFSKGYRVNQLYHPRITQSGRCQSLLYIELASLLTEQEEGDLKQEIKHLLSEVEKVNQDFPAMLRQAEQVTDFYPEQLETQEHGVASELKRFFHWLGQSNFIFLGYQSLRVNGTEQEIHLEKQPSSALGLLALASNELFHEKSCEYGKALLNEDDEQALREFAADKSASAIYIAKSSQLSTVHRHDYFDQISVKAFDQQGQLVAIHYWLGLFTQRANSQNPRYVPYLQNKYQAVLAKLSAPSQSHTYRKIEHILEALPKRELYESSIEQLYQLAKGIYRLNGQNQSGTFVRENSNNQQVSVLVFVGKDVFCTDLRDDIESLLCQAYQGNIISRHSLLNDNALAQWHFVVVRTSHQPAQLSLTELVAQISAKTRSWHEKLTGALFENFCGQQAQIYAKHYAKSFSKSYREKFAIAEAITDIGYFEKLTPKQPYQFHLAPYQNDAEQLSSQHLHNTVKLNIYSLQQKVALSESIPILENIGFRPLDEFSFANVATNSANLCSDLYTYTLECRGTTFDIAKIKANLEAGLEQIWCGAIENDGYNKLLIAAELNVRQIVIMRAYGKYLRQLGLGYSEDYFQQALVQHPIIVKKLVRLFELRFGVDMHDSNQDQIEQRNEQTERAKAELLTGLNEVEKTDHDRILRNFIAAICATVRTNFYQRSENGEVKPYCSFKIKTSDIDDAPEPRPYIETFIYSPKVEGVHLRFAPVSRGGLRWSDRPEDFRTEVLGLVKAQQVKNVVIVPQGAKGTFVPKQLPEQGSRDEVTQEAIACYKMFISGLLDITDNNTATGIVKPDNVICFDGDDSYLVVAADKGTATFSDIANQVANDYGFWLGDAFASGGSVGYDHKKMGITAKGAWVSVQRHFREMNIDVQTDAIKVAGIGDMSGDVFGNGMLLSNSIELVAAFDHRDIFIDPTPNAATSFAERQRLFNLPRSSWRDYNAELISKGGNVFSRQLKKITLSAQIKQCLGIDENIHHVSPDELIRYILTAHIDLLWFGGIGTYVKASYETHLEISDKANDTLRINGNQLNCKVIGEGGNLGCSQLARIEFAKKGGRINTDAVDNSAGVNCSDNEVNIKILLNALVVQQKLTTAEREYLLEQMTDDVADMVLKNNYYQAQALSLDEANSQTHFDSFTRLTHYLVSSVALNRELEFLPDDEELQSRSGKGLTRPELAVLMAYSKMDVHNALLTEKQLLTDPYFNRYLLAAFPQCLAKSYQQDIFQHSLAKPIVATLVANEIFNRGGIHAVREQTGASIAEIVKAFVIAKEIFNLDDIWQHIEQLENEVPAHLQIKMMIEVQRFYRLMAIWFVNHADADASIEQIVQTYRPSITELQQLDSDELTLPFMPIDGALYQLDGKGKCLVEKIHQLKVSSVVFCDIVKTANELHLCVTQALRCFSQLSQSIDLSWFIEQTDKVKALDHWSRLARFSLLLELLERREKLVVNIIKSRRKQQPEQTIANWTKSKRGELERIARIIDDLKSAGEISLEKLYFANRQIGLLLE